MLLPIARIRRVLRGLLCCVLPIWLFGLTAAAEVPYDSYTYWQGDGGSRKAVSARPMYEPLRSIRGADIGAESFENLTDIAADGDGVLYILDAGRGVLHLVDGAFSPIGQIGQVTVDGESADLTGAKGVFAVDRDHIYVADTERARVLLTDGSGTVSRVLTLPDSPLIPEGFAFRPSKVTADTQGYVYVLSEGSFYGALIYKPDGSFGGFYGANKVFGPSVGFIDRLRDLLFSNNDKRGNQMRKLPFQFTDLTVDGEGYIYTITGRTNTTIAQGQIKRLNAAGSDILKNGDMNFADEALLVTLGETRAQDLLSLDVDADGFIYALDSLFGRVFVYDEESSLLTTFGGGLSEGEQLGTFRQAVAIAATTRDVYVADSVKKSVTVFRLGAYGQAVRECQKLSLHGHYAEAEAGWRALLAEDRTDQLAYRALGQAEILHEDYDAALGYARMAGDKELYSQAYRYVREAAVRRDFVWIFPLCVAAVVLLSAALIVTKKRRLTPIRSRTVRELFAAQVHPFAVYGEMKEKRRSGSFIACGVMTVLFYLATVLRQTGSGFLFSTYDAAQFNAFLTLVGTAGLAVLWAVVNWLVTTLFGGEGRLPDVLTVTCYGLLPLVVTKLLAVPLSYVLLLQEGTFLSLLETIGVLWTLVLILVGTMIVHDMGLWKTVGTSVLTILGMGIVVFVVFMVTILLQQGYGFVATVLAEAFGR